jgi:hypothetical protein
VGFVCPNSKKEMEVSLSVVNTRQLKVYDDMTSTYVYAVGFMTSV